VAILIRPVMGLNLAGINGGAASAHVEATADSQMAAAAGLCLSRIHSTSTSKGIVS
jgi:hypothetical protein